MIRYKLLKSELTGDVYPQQVDSAPFDLEKLKEKLSQTYGGQAASVLDDAIDVIARRLSEGDTVSLDGLGTFSLRLGMRKKGVKHYEDVRSQDIRINGVRFNASQSLRQQIADQEIHLQPGDKQLRQVTADDRWCVLYSHMLDEFHRCRYPIADITVTVSSYRLLTGCTDYTARKELEIWCSKGRLRKIPVGKSLVYGLSEELCRAAAANL